MAVAAIPWVMAAVGAASSHMQNQAQDAQIEARNRQIEMNNQAAIEQMGDNYAALNDEQQKAAAESLEQSQQVQLEGIRSKAQTNLMAAATGMGGNSVEDMFYAVERDKSKNISNIIGNYEDRVYEINQNAENVWNQAKGSIQSKLNKPSGWSKAANVVVGGVKGYMMGSTLAGSLGAAAPASASAGGGLGFSSLFQQKAAPIIKAGI